MLRSLRLRSLYTAGVAVGAGVTSLLFFLTLKKIHAIDARNEVRRAHEQQKKDGGADNGNA